jgi:hypothetical protein
VRRPRLFTSPLPGLLLSTPVFKFIPLSGFASVAGSNFCLPPTFPGAEFHRVVGSCNIVAWPDSLITCRGCCARTVLKPSSRPGLIAVVAVLIFLRFCIRSHCSWVLFRVHRSAPAGFLVVRSREVSWSGFRSLLDQLAGPASSFHLVPEFFPARGVTSAQESRLSFQVLIFFFRLLCVDCCRILFRSHS